MTRVKMIVQNGGYGLRDTNDGFTLIELIIVIAIFGMVALLAIPMLSSAGSVQIHAAAKMIATDLEYAKGLAITRSGLRRSLDSENRSIATLYKERGPQRVTVVFDPNQESYQVFRESNKTLVPIEHPVRRGFGYEINFKTDGRLDKVDLVSADFDKTNVVKFDCLGSPYNGNGDCLNSGFIRLQAGESTATVKVGPGTGDISIE